MSAGREVAGDHAEPTWAALRLLAGLSRPAWRPHFLLFKMELSEDRMRQATDPLVFRSIA